MVRFQKLTRNLFLTLHGHNYHISSGNCPSISYANSSSLLMLTADQFPRWRRSRKRLSVHSVFRCPDLCLQCSVSFVHGLEKTHGASFLNRARNSRCTNHKSGHLKTEHTESLFLLWRHLGNWPRSKHEKRTAGSAWGTRTVTAADGVHCARV